MQIVMRINGLGIWRDTYKTSAAYVYIESASEYRPVFFSEN